MFFVFLIMAEIVESFLFFSLFHASLDISLEYPQHMFVKTLNFHFWGADPPFRGVNNYCSAKTKIVLAFFDLEITH
jgi:hypothetical protein